MREVLMGQEYWQMLEATGRRVESWPDWKTGSSRSTAESVLDRHKEQQENVMEKLICDFCSERDAKWLFEANNFRAWTVEDLQKMLAGGWSACDTCKQLVEKNDAKALIVRSIETMVNNAEFKITSTELRSLRDGIAKLIYDFFAKRAEREKTG